MTSSLRSLRRAVRDDPYDATARLVLADILQEHDYRRAEAEQRAIGAMLLRTPQLRRHITHAVGGCTGELLPNDLLGAFDAACVAVTSCLFERRVPFGAHVDEDADGVALVALAYACADGGLALAVRRTPGDVWICPVNRAWEGLHVFTCWRRRPRCYPDVRASLETWGRTYKIE